MGTATKLRDVDGFLGEASLYRLSPPLEQNEYVIVSAAELLLSGPETYIFPADEDGEVVSWGELDGSYHGGLSHAEALNGAGYEVTAEAN